MAESISCICIGCLDLAPADWSKKKKMMSLRILMQLKSMVFNLSEVTAYVLVHAKQNLCHYIPIV